jgi:muramoyltetrapeptide carboxypeptidase
MTIKPKQLQIGDTIGILSPAYLSKQDTLLPAIEKLKEKGFQVKIAKNTFKDTYGYAASPEERADDFNSMIADSSVKMLLFGGGEVCNEILPLMDYSMIRENPKIICSYSDSTTILNAVTALSGLVTYYGQSPRTFFNLTDYNYQCFQSAFCNSGIPIYTPNSKWQTIHGGVCNGRLIGGYLVNFAVMLNGNYFRYDTHERYILFLEDLDQFNPPVVVSKYLSHIEQSGLLKCVSGLIFGHYSDEESPVINDILARVASKYDIPTVRCDDFGHYINNAILPIGISAEVDADKSTLVFKEPLVNPIY